MQEDFAAWAVFAGDPDVMQYLGGATQLYEGFPRDDNSLKVPVSWDLTPYRGKALRLLLVDEVSTEQYDYLGTTGFDILTAYNGP